MYNELSPADKIAKDAYTDADGIVRWKSNDSVPPADILENASLPEATVLLSTHVRELETEAFLADYVRQQEEFWTEPKYAEARAEQRAEMRAAFGPGEEVVNVFTGRKHRT